MHTALVAAAFTLPSPKTRAPHDPVTIDLFSRPTPTPKEDAPKPEPPKPEPPKLEPPRPEPPKVASRDLTKPHPDVPQPQPPVEPPKPEPSSGSLVEPLPGEKKKVDLTLHALPGGGDNGNSVIVPNNGTGSLGNGTLGPNGGVGGNGKKPWHVDAGNAITGKLPEEKEDRFPLRAVGNGEYEYKGKAFHARIMRDGRVSFDDKSIRDFKGLSGGFDITDMMMKGKGNDPYRAEKDAFMKTTDEMRKKMAQANLKERRMASLLTLPTQLAEIWHDTSRSVEARRKTLQETWLDAAMSTADAGDAAKEACAIIETYVRRYLPQGTPDGYSEEELETLNRGKKHKFAPYR